MSFWPRTSNNGKFRTTIILLLRRQHHHQQPQQQHHHRRNVGQDYHHRHQHHHHDSLVPLGRISNLTALRSFSTTTMTTTKTSSPSLLSQPNDYHDETELETIIAQKEDVSIKTQIREVSHREDWRRSNRATPITSTTSTSTSSKPNNSNSILPKYGRKHGSRDRDHPSTFKTSTSSKSSSSSLFRPVQQLRFRDEYLPCRQHLDPNGHFLPTSNWIQIVGTLPVTSVDEVVTAVEGMLYREAYKTDIGDDGSRSSSNSGGIIDLDAVWNPIQDGRIPPTIRLDGNNNDHHHIDDGGGRSSLSAFNIHTDGTDDYYHYYSNDGDDNTIKLSWDDDDDDDDNRGQQSIPQHVQPQSSSSLSSSSVQQQLLRVHAAHVILSPFGRPNGWNVQLANPSMVNAILTRASNLERKRDGRGGGLRIGWKLVQVQEFHPPTSSSSSTISDSTNNNNHNHNNNKTRTTKTNNNNYMKNRHLRTTKTNNNYMKNHHHRPRGAAASGGRRRGNYNDRRHEHIYDDDDCAVPIFGTGTSMDTMILVDDTMVRFENCPSTLDGEHLRYLLSRYDLAPTGDTILKWDGSTDDGRVAPLTYVVRFASSAWARAAVRELQATWMDGKMIKLVQYPNQMRAKG